MSLQFYMMTNWAVIVQEGFAKKDVLVLSLPGVGMALNLQSNDSNIIIIC